MASGLSAELLSSLDMAFNEADFCDFSVTPDQNEATLLLRVLTLPDEGRNLKIGVSCSGSEELAGWPHRYELVAETMRRPPFKPSA